MSDSDQNTNAITEQQRKEQLSKLNVDESITVVNNSVDSIPKDVKNTANLMDNNLSEVSVQNDLHVNGTESGALDGEQTNIAGNIDPQSVAECDKIQNKDISNEVLEEVVDDISKGIVEDFSKNIATYVTEVVRFDEKYEKEQKENSSEVQEKESASSESEATENSVENNSNSHNIEEVNDNEKESPAPNTESDNQENPNKETSPIDLENVKENDVKDECFKEEEKEQTKKDNKDENEDDDGYLDLLGNGLLRRKVLEGKDVEDIKPFHGELVTINASGKLEDGTIVDNFTNLTFAVGEGDVIQAWDLGVMTAKVGQTIELITDSKYAYGELGREPDIPSNATITYTIKLHKKEDAPDVFKLEIDERLTMAEKKRERGNALFARNDYAGAINSYNKAIKILESGSLQGTPEKLQDLADCRLKCCNNMAACQLKVEAYDAAIKSCLSVLDLKPDNVKALFRIGKAYTAKGEIKDGIQYLQRALKLEPESKVIKQEIRKLSQKLSKEAELEKDMYKKMMGTKTTASAKPAKDTQKSWKWPIAGGIMAALVAAGVAAYRYGHH